MIPPYLAIRFDHSMPQPYAVAQAILDGFNQHYERFRTAARNAIQLFEAANWVELEKTSKARITYYDERIQATVNSIQTDFDLNTLNQEEYDAFWQAVKYAFINLKRLLMRSISNNEV